MRVALLSEIPAPHRLPLWNALAERSDVELRVLLLREHDPRRKYDLHRDEWRFDARVLGGRDALVRGRWVVLSRGVRRELADFRPDVVAVGGWNQPAYLGAGGWARRRGVPVVAWVESTARDARAGRRPVEWMKRRLVRSADAFLVPGRAAGDYVRSFGVGDERIAVAPNAVDRERFAERVDRERAHRDGLRRELGLNGCCVLCVSRLSREKGVDVLVRAAARAPFAVVVVGDGPQRDELERTAPPNVRLVGRLSRDELPRWYAAADVFALTSRSEAWGMALSEAAAAGLPLVASEAVGAAYDLVEPGVNGFRVAVGDVSGLQEVLVRLAGDEAFRAKAGARSLALAEDATPERWAEAVAALARGLVRS